MTTLQDIVNLLDHHLCVGPGKQLTKIIFDYFCLVDFLWDEQQLEEEELSLAKHLLRKVLSLSPLKSENIETGAENSGRSSQPWYLGSGSHFVNTIIEHSGLTKGSIIYEPFKLYQLGELPSTSRENSIYILNDATTKFDYFILEWSVKEEDLSIAIPHRAPIIKRLPRGVGVFINDLPPPIIRQTFNKSLIKRGENFSSKLVSTFSMSKTSSVDQCCSLFGADYFYNSIKNWINF
jgi:hypothetical protein